MPESFRLSSVREVIGDSDNIRYHEVDATNYSSLRKALEGAKGELHITTEGLLMYFTQPEIETVFGNIRKLLLEFGGRWVTVDNELTKASGKAIAAVTSDMPEEIAAEIGHIAAGAVSKTTLANNVFFDADIEKALVLSDTLKATVNKKSSEVNKPATASKPATSKNPVEKKTEVKKVAGKKK